MKKTDPDRNGWNASLWDGQKERELRDGINLPLSAKLEWLEHAARLAENLAQRKAVKEQLQHYRGEKGGSSGTSSTSRNTN